MWPAARGPEHDRGMSTFAEARGYHVGLAGAGDLASVQRLRHDTFAAEFPRMSSLEQGRDTDEFDDHCDHLVVRHEASRQIVGTYRMMPPECAAAVGGRFGDRTFDLSPLRDLEADLVEVGRACVHPDHRNGAVISLVWAGIAGYMRENGRRRLGGCAWVRPDEAPAIWAYAQGDHLAPDAYRVRPRHRLADGPLPAVEPVKPPPLLHGYLRLGGWICGEPGLDRDAGVAAFYVLLDLQQMTPRYRRHFLGV
jgi:putative hemolysin